MGYLILIAYIGFGTYFDYTPGDWIVAAIVWGIVYFSAVTEDTPSVKENTKNPGKLNTQNTLSDAKIFEDADSRSAIDELTHIKKELSVSKKPQTLRVLKEKKKYQILDKDELLFSDFTRINFNKWGILP